MGLFRKYETDFDGAKSHLVLVNPSNMGNLGTIIRTSIGFGINNLAIIRPAVDIYDPKCIRSSMGAFFELNFKYFDSFNDYLNYASLREIFPFMLTRIMKSITSRRKSKIPTKIRRLTWTRRGFTFRRKNGIRRRCVSRKRVYRFWESSPRSLSSGWFLRRQGSSRRSL